MTGQEWFDKFNHELKGYISDLELPEYEIALEVARRASGIYDTVAETQTIKLVNLPQQSEAEMRPKVWYIIHKVIEKQDYDTTMAALDEMLALISAHTSNAVRQAQAEVLDRVGAEVNLLKILPVEIPHHSPYISGVNETVKKIKQRIATLKQSVKDGGK